MTPEFVRCDECQCWTTDHWVFKEEAGKGKIKNPNFGICQRRAPIQAGETYGNWNILYTRIFGIMIPIGIYTWGKRNRVLPSKRFDEGCWEGIRKDTVEKCDTA